MNFVKRFLSSIVIILLIVVLLQLNLIYFNFFLVTILIYSFFELNILLRNRFLFYIGSLLITISFYTAFKIINLDINLFIMILLISIGADIGGYFIGKIFGGPKLTSISPNKTIAGFVGGLFFSFFFVQVYLIIINPSFSIQFEFNYLFILILSIFSQIGDIFVSYLKRQSNIKDTGKLIPGHGGLLDRIDGMIFVFPLSFIFYLL